MLLYEIFVQFLLLYGIFDNNYCSVKLVYAFVICTVTVVIQLICSIKTYKKHHYNRYLDD